MYCDIKGNIFNFLKKFVHETSFLQPIIILSILFCILNIFWLYLYMCECVYIYIYIYKKNSMALVRERTIPTERPPPVGEVSANFYIYISFLQPIIILTILFYILNIFCLYLYICMYIYIYEYFLTVSVHMCVYIYTQIQSKNIQDAKENSEDYDGL
jgi:hypothetical protein